MPMTDDDFPWPHGPVTTNVVPIRDDVNSEYDEMQAAIYGAAEPEREPLELFDPSDWDGQDPPERRWMVKDMLPHGQATLFTGAGSAGKSLASQQMATCIAIGRPWLGVEVEQATAVYISCEDDLSELWRRQKAICEALGFPMSVLKGRLYLLSLAGKIDNELATFDDRGRLHVAGRFRDLQDACARIEARFVALDNTGHFFAGNENDRHQVAAFVNLCNGLAATIDGSVLIIGHPNKAGAEFSGSTAWENQVRSRLFMETPADENGNITDPDLRVIRRGKSNYAQKGAEIRFRWYKWAFVLPGDMAEDSRINVEQQAQDAFDNECFLTCLDIRNQQYRAVSGEKRSRTFAPREFAKMAESKGIGTARLEDAMERLFRIGAIEIAFLWRDKGEGKDRYGLRRVPADISAEFKNDPLTSKNDPLTYPLSSRRHTADIPLTYPLSSPPPKGGGLKSPPPRGGDDRDEGGNRLDEIPPWDEPPPSEAGDWRDNPILNPPEQHED